MLKQFYILIVSSGELRPRKFHKSQWIFLSRQNTQIAKVLLFWRKWLVERTYSLVYANPVLIRINKCLILTVKKKQKNKKTCHNGLYFFIITCFLFLKKTVGLRSKGILGYFSFMTIIVFLNPISRLFRARDLSLFLCKPRPRIWDVACFPFRNAAVCFGWWGRIVLTLGKTGVWVSENQYRI